MIYERSAGAVVFRKVQGEPYYLLLRSGRNYWNFPKGQIEEKEGEMEVARREIQEETGIENLQFFKRFREKDHWIFRSKYPHRGGKRGEMIAKDAVFYLAETPREEVQISDEHEEYGWFCYPDAIKHLKFLRSRRILQSAHRFLQTLHY